MTKIDFKKELKQLYRPSAKAVELVEVPAMNFLMIDGSGDPNGSEEFAQAVEALFGLAYTIKFMVKKGELGIDYGVMPLEGLWWVEDMTKFDPTNKADWLWTAMIMQPQFVTAALVADAGGELARKKNPAALPRVRFESLAEGTAAQIMHIGPFSEEGPAIAQVHEAIRSAGGELQGKHHEIYLSDIRKAAPEKWKTIVRQPYRLG